MISIITGQTATGKTSKAIELAKEKNGVLLNFDSRQIYKYLDIVTGKDREEGVTILGYDLVDPKEPFSSFDFVKYATRAIDELLEQGKHPILVGGTYLYLSQLLYGQPQKLEPNWELREKLEDYSVQQLQELLKSHDVDLFASLNDSDKRNPHRLMRKIEKAEAGLTDRPLNTTPHYDIDRFDCYFFGEQEQLEETITQRVEMRLRQGAVEETKDLLAKGYTKDDPGLKTIGYQQFIQFCDGEIPREEAVSSWIRAEIQYAKRQKTCMKKDRNLTIIEV